MAKDKETKAEDQPTPSAGDANVGETVTTPDGQNQVRLGIDESSVESFYSSITRISGTAEEILIDFSQGIRPTGQNAAVLKVDARVTLSPWAAKRLALALGQTIQRYEQTYGLLEVDPRKRQSGSTTTAS